MAFGVTADGFNRKRVSDIRTELQTDFKTYLGNDLDVSEQSNAGALIDVLTKKFATLWEGFEEVYNSRDPDAAVGIQLDRACAEVGVYRNKETSSTVQCVMSGDDQTLVPVNSSVEQDTTQEEFLLLQSTTIDSANAVRSIIEISTVVDNTVYTLTINGTNYSINSGTNATVESIVAALKVEVGINEPITFTDNLDGSAQLDTNTSNVTFSVSISSNIDITEVSSVGEFAATNKGAISVPANTINTIKSGVTGWNSVKNLQSGLTGQEQETDEQLRIRRDLALYGSGTATDQAIQGNIRNEVANVTSCKVISNRTSEVVDGRPAKSFEVIVQGGADQEIAQKIWDTQPSGIESYGTSTHTVVDSNGDNQTIKFSRPASKYLWIIYTLDTYSEEVLTPNLITTIQDAVVQWALQEYTPGKDVFKDRLKVPVYNSTSGVGDISVQIAVTDTEIDTPVYQTTSIAISDREQVVASPLRIAVLTP